MMLTSLVGAVVARIAALIVKEQGAKVRPSEKGGRAGVSGSIRMATWLPFCFPSIIYVYFSEP